LLVIFTAEAQSTQRVLFLLLSAETPESKNPQALAGYDDLILSYKRFLDYVFFAASLLSSFPLPSSQRQRKKPSSLRPLRLERSGR
jgi:hypothetical protein